jgi:hypothetical protein
MMTNNKRIRSTPSPSPAPDPALDELTQSIKEDFAAIAEGKAAIAQSKLEQFRRYRAAGEKLIRVKAMLDHGDWTLWLKTHFDHKSRRQARRYIRFSKTDAASDLKTEEATWKEINGHKPACSSFTNYHPAAAASMSGPIRPAQTAVRGMLAGDESANEPMPKLDRTEAPPPPPFRDYVFRLHGERDVMFDRMVRTLLRVRGFTDPADLFYQLARDAYHRLPWAARLDPATVEAIKRHAADAPDYDPPSLDEMEAQIDDRYQGAMDAAEAAMDAAPEAAWREADNGR